MALNNKTVHNTHPKNILTNINILLIRARNTTYNNIVLSTFFNVQYQSMEFSATYHGVALKAAPTHKLKVLAINIMQFILSVSN